MGKKSLGRGLSAIFKDHQIFDDEVENNSVLTEIPMSSIVPNPFQPRVVFNEDEILELAQTIQEHGLIQPIVVRKHEDHYQIVAGERRFRACQSLSYEKIPARVMELLSDKQMMEWAIIENIQRVELSPIEEAQSYEKLIEHFNYTHEMLAERVGKSRSAITNTLRLTKLPDQVQTWIKEKKLSAGHARNLLRPEITDPVKAAEEIIEKGFSVRETEKISKPKKEGSGKVEKENIHFKEFVQEFMYALGTQVKIRGTFENGVIEIPFHGADDLQRLADLVRHGANTAYNHET